MTDEKKDLPDTSRVLAFVLQDTLEEMNYSGGDPLTDEQKAAFWDELRLGAAALAQRAAFAGNDKWAKRCLDVSVLLKSAVHHAKEGRAKNLD